MPMHVKSNKYNFCKWLKRVVTFGEIESETTEESLLEALYENYYP